MKYLKLFESWINEADGESSKPFNPDKPDETLIVDISAQDLASLDDKKLAAALSSILNRAYFTKEGVLTNTKLTVSPCYFTDKSSNFTAYSKRYGKAEMSDGDTKFNIYVLSDDDKSNFDKITDAYIEKAKGSMEPSFIVYLESEPIKLVKFSKETDIVVLNSRCFLLHPNESWKNTFKGGPEDFAISCEMYVQKDNNMPLFDTKITLGDLVLTLQDTMKSKGEFNTDLGGHAASNVGWAFGLELPDKYAPKMGGIKRESK